MNIELNLGYHKFVRFIPLCGFYTTNLYELIMFGFEITDKSISKIGYLV